MTQSQQEIDDKMEIKFEINKELGCKQLLLQKLEGNDNTSNNSNNSNNRNNTECDSNANE